ncbi:MAG: DNA methyltransferase [Candidatus Rehaiarchaeum fermentans]|nr:DNA methyltransferase [Candidatus Rehaiarchaeum fermentans]
MNKKDYNSILEDCYNKALKEIEKDNGKSFIDSLETSQRKWILRVAEKSESFKAVVTALTTSLVKKIEDPKQDIRYHKHEFKGGYSGRTLDTNYVTPFFKKKFRRLAMKESGWLTRSIEQPHPFTLDFPGKIRDRGVKESFLQIINDIEENNANPEKYLIALFILLIQVSTFNQTKFKHSTFSSDITIEEIIDCLKSHFFERYSVSGASRLPVIAIYSIYQILMEDIARFKGKKLLPLRSHLSSDIRARRIGDIEVVDENGDYFEAVEIKYGIPIDSLMIGDSFEKFKETPIKRYYLLTTSEPNIKKGNEKEVKEIVEKIKNEHGCEVIINGLIPSLKYYLRLLKNPSKFIDNYTKNLQNEFSKTTEIKEIHIKTWEKIIMKIIK